MVGCGHTAAVIGSSPTAVRVAQHRGLTRLRGALENAQDGSVHLLDDRRLADPDRRDEQRRRVAAATRVSA